jgi:predicted ATP-grasp superfamily ATP-dependent carboligase
MNEPIRQERPKTTVPPRDQTPAPQSSRLEPEKRRKVLILDGEQRSALAATRSLGAKGVEVVVGGETDQTLAGHSKYCREKVVYPSPARSPQEFVETVREETRKRDISILLPMTEITTTLVLRERDRFEGLGIPFPSYELFDLLTDKWRVMEMAGELGVPIPRTHFIRDLEGLRTVSSETTFPVVLKPYRSRIWCQDRWIEASVKYAHSFRELSAVARRFHCFSHHPFLVQELIHGQGHGIFGLYQNGRSVVFFGHRRLRERPPSGGVSVLSESVEMNQRAFLSAKTILDHVRWHGVAMVEFKISEDGTPYLMEINPRFWGSLQLSIDGGVDFPWLLYCMESGATCDVPQNYKVGLKNRWLVGDAAHVYSLFARNGKGLHLPRSQKWHSLLGFLNFFDSTTRYEINRWGDLSPFLFEVKHLMTRR